MGVTGGGGLQRHTACNSRACSEGVSLLRSRRMIENVGIRPHLLPPIYTRPGQRERSVLVPVSVTDRNRFQSIFSEQIKVESSRPYRTFNVKFMLRISTGLSLRPRVDYFFPYRRRTVFSFRPWYFPCGSCQYVPPSSVVGYFLTTTMM